MILGVIYPIKINDRINNIKKNMKLENQIKTNNYEEDLKYILIIPRINLKKAIYNISSEKNNIKYNVKLLESSNIKDNILYIASHTGNQENCYFNKIKELEVDDKIYIFDKKITKEYNIIKKYYIEKNGVLSTENIENNSVILITCDINNNQLQLIIIATLYNIDNKNKY